MTPVVVFAYNRPAYLQQVLQAIQRQTVLPPQLCFYVDGPSSPATEACLRQIQSLPFSMVAISARPTNYGCATNIMLGLEEVSSQFSQFVVLEDDTIPDPRWYESMLILLNHYREANNIGAVGGFPSLKKEALPDYQYDVILSPRFSCWGWGSWSDKWRELHADWLQYRTNRVPPWDVAALPLDAGHDIHGMIGMQHLLFWDVLVAGSLLQRRWLHAITKRYLVVNIGADNNNPNTHLMNLHAILDTHIPQRFPSPEPGLDPSVGEAVREYVRMMS